MTRFALVLLMLVAVPLHAQQPQPRPQAPAKPAAPAQPAAPTAPSAPQRLVGDPEAGGQPVNIRVDVSVLDQAGSGTPVPKTLLVILADRALGRTRAAFQDRLINVDARPTLIDGRIRVSLTVQSEPTRGSPTEPLDATLSWRNSFSLMLDNGKPMLAFETSDAATKRKLSIEVKATIQK
jgi:hypothetical protein